ncbi:MAG TPA: hypothetical protein VKB09_06120 [Thermomicrobiales bacterium]|nr:hypothetical protein [Thermomicrobiales bacterium]
MPDLFLELRESDDRRGISPPPLSEEEALSLLQEAEITATKLIPWGSNYSFAVALETDDGREQLAIYKPRSGEAPLYDFPAGTLYLRETAAYLLSRRLGWNLVPPTVVRSGPHGIGSVQLYVQPQAEDGDGRRFWGSCVDEIERLVLFDHIANNADRKISHCLRDLCGKVWGIDHGLTFNEYPKLRTVLWQFVGQEVSSALLKDLQVWRRDERAHREELGKYLSRAELNAVLARVDRFLQTGKFPALNPHRNVPYGWW